MTDFETVVICLLIPVAYVFAYIAGKCDFLNVVCLMMAEYTKKMQEALKDDENA